MEFNPNTLRLFIVIGYQYVIIFLVMFRIILLGQYILCVLYSYGNDIVVNLCDWYGEDSNATLACKGSENNITG